MVVLLKYLSLEIIIGLALLVAVTRDIKIISSFDHTIVMIVCTTIGIIFFHLKKIMKITMWMIKHLEGLVTIVQIILASSIILLGLLIFHFSKLANYQV
jgi:hypothetical protein